MDQDVQKPAEPSTAVSAVADGWDEHGTPIVTKKPESPKKEDSAASATPAKQAEPEKDAESGAANQEPKPKGKLTADERIKQLTAERKASDDRANALEERLRKLESAAQPTPKAAEPGKPKEPPKRPNPYDWKGTKEEFDTAMDEYEQYRDSQTAARVRQEQAKSEAQKSMSDMLKQATAKYPDAEQKIKTATTEILSKAPEYVQAFVNGSEVLGDLLYTLADETTRTNLLKTAETDPGKALRVLRDMELEIQKTLSAPKTKEQAKDEPKPKEEAPPETKPRAPKPPSEVGGRGASTEDAAVAAARDGKFDAFEAAQWGRFKRAS